MADRAPLAPSAENDEQARRRRERAVEQPGVEGGLEDAATAFSALSAPPGVMRTGDVLALQRAVGNRATIRRLAPSQAHTARPVHRRPEPTSGDDDDELLDLAPGGEGRAPGEAGEPGGNGESGDAGDNPVQRHPAAPHRHEQDGSVTMLPPPQAPPQPQGGNVGQQQPPPPPPPPVQQQGGGGGQQPPGQQPPPPPPPPVQQQQAPVQQQPPPQQQPPQQQGGTPPVSSNFATYGIKEGTGPQSKLAKGAMNVGEGILNAVVAPLNPRWWYKAYSDIAGIKASDYGGGAAGKVLAVLSGISQVCQKISAVAGVVGLALGIAAAILGALMGAGAACALASSICGLIAFIASGVAFILQAILVIGNGIRGAWGAGGDQKKRLLADIAGLIGTALGTAAGGLGVNFGGGQGLFNSGTKSVADTMVGGFSNAGDLVNGQVQGATSVASQVGGEFAKTGFGQGFGTVSDMVSEGVGGVSPRHDPAIAQRQAAAAATFVQREDDPSELKSAIGQFITGLGQSRAQDQKVESDMQSSIDAADATAKKIDTPLSQTGGGGGMGGDMSIGSSSEALPSKLSETDKALDESANTAEKTGKFSKKDEAKLEKADTDVAAAEEKMGVTAEPPKKKSLFRRFKDWLVNKVLNIKARIKKVIQSAKLKIASVAMDVLGVSSKVGDLKGAINQDRAANQQSLADAEESTAAADDAETKAKELMSSIDKK